MNTKQPGTDAAAAKPDKPAKKASGVRAENGDRANVRRGLVEQEIYHHATRLFAERGFAGTTFQDIADAVGLTRPALYHYVRSKDELLAKLVAEITVDAAARFWSIARRDDLSAAEKVHEIIAASVRRQAEHTTRYQLLIKSEADLPEDIAAQHAAARHAVLRALSGVIEAGIAEGTFRPLAPRVAALALLGMNNWVAWWYQPDGRYDLDSICEQLADMAVAALRNPDDRNPASEGPRGVLELVRQDLDRLERLLD
jgi:AcrR family transcriptional regulator